MFASVSRFEGILRLIEARASEFRKAGRVPIESSLKCSLGRVVDCSRTGLRVKRHRALCEGPVELHLWDDRGSIVCEATVVWSRRCGLLRYEAGLILPALGAEDEGQLRRLVDVHRDTRSFAARDAA